MLTLEPRASDDETLESEASIGTADSSENLNVDSEGTISDFCGMLHICRHFFFVFHIDPMYNNIPGQKN